MIAEALANQTLAEITANALVRMGHSMEKKQGGTPRLLLTVVETAKSLSMGRDGVYKLLWREGPDGLRSVKVGRRRLIPVRELERWIAEQIGDDLPPAA